MGILDFVHGLFTGIGRKRIVSGARVIVHVGRIDLRGVVLKDKTGSRRKRVLVRLDGGREVVAKRNNVTVD